MLSVLLLPSAAPRAILVYHGGARGAKVALTFDAGADRGYAADILHTLEHLRVRASFGMTGTWARSNPDLVRRMVRDGDILMNHTYDHRSFTGFSTNTAPLTAAQRAWETWAADATVRRLTGRGLKPYFRPPFGDLDSATLTQVRRLGYRFVVMWTIDSLGWNHLPAAAILRRCLAMVAPGSVIAMHVGSQSQDAAALPALIIALKRRHYHLVTIRQLLAVH